jgi:hypothetical protein
MIEQLNYLTKAEVREQSLQRQRVVADKRKKSREEQSNGHETVAGEEGNVEAAHEGKALEEVAPQHAAHE